MRKANIFVYDQFAGFLIEESRNAYRIEYCDDYSGPPISLAMPISQKVYVFDHFPPFFDGLLPEGPQLEGLLRYGKLDRYDYFGQLVHIGKNVIGAVTVEEVL